MHTLCEGALSWESISLWTWKSFHLSLSDIPVYKVEILGVEIDPFVQSNLQRFKTLYHIRLSGSVIFKSFLRWEIGLLSNEMFYLWIILLESLHYIDIYYPIAFVLWFYLHPDSTQNGITLLRDILSDIWRCCHMSPNFFFPLRELSVFRYMI